MDRRFIWALLLMMAIAIVPTFLLKPSKPAAGVPGQAADTTAVVPSPAPAATTPAAPPALSQPLPAPAEAAPAETVSVRSQLYDYEVSTRGGALVQATMLKLADLNPAEKGGPARLVADGDVLHQLGVLSGKDTLWFRDWDFTPSARSLDVTSPQALTLSATRGGVTLDLTYRFRPDNYLMGVSGRLTGLGPVGGQLVVGMGTGLRQVETDSAGNYYTYGVVTKTDASHSTPFSKLKADQPPTTLDGPFEWAAVKAKYFVAALLAVDSGMARISGVTAKGLPARGIEHRAAVTFGVPIPAAGTFNYELYVGPMEYPRLRAIGHDFYDINPYGWPGFRTMIRPIAVGARWLLVWMHENLNLAYGMVLVLFGVLIRVILWPLNQKGMRASLKMQALQPEMQALQDKHKEDPQALQREVMQLYKKHNVNPFSGCWPMLLPWPILLALFFVLQNTLELRGQAFMWLPDLSLKDPLFILPVLMGASMFALNKVGMRGLPPTPQTKMMLYFLPAIMTVMFVNFASGLNLYYFVQNMVSIPQQWYLSKERLKAQPPAQAAVVPVKKKKS